MKIYTDMIGRLLIGCMLTLIVLGSAQAQVSVNNVLYTFKSSERPVKNITVYNTGVTPVYITVKVEEVRDLGADSTAYDVTSDLLVSPKNFSIAPNGRRTARMLLKGAPKDKEKAYRVLFLPQQSEFGEEQVKTGKVKQNSLVMRVITGIGIVVYAEPIKAEPNLAVERQGSQLTFTNAGNIQALVSAGVSCPPSVTLDKHAQSIYWDFQQSQPLKALGCTRFEGKRIHAGKSHTVSVPPGDVVYFKRRFGSQGDLDPIEVKPSA